MNTKSNIKKPWLKPFVKVVSVKKDTYSGTRGTKEAGAGAGQNPAEYFPN